MREKANGVTYERVEAEQERMCKGCVFFDGAKRSLNCTDFDWSSECIRGDGYIWKLAEESEADNE